MFKLQDKVELARCIGIGAYERVTGTVVGKRHGARNDPACGNIYDVKLADGLLSNIREAELRLALVAAEEVTYVAGANGSAVPVRHPAKT